MSWVKSVLYSGEDVFDENADDISLLNREWASNMKRRIRVKQIVSLSTYYFVYTLGKSGDHKPVIVYIYSVAACAGF